MKYLKRAFQVISILALFLLVAILAILKIDFHNSAYLNINKNKGRTSCLITNVHIVPMTSDTVMRNKTILIRDGIIESIDDAITVDGIEVINGNHMFLSPGLIDMHVHLWDQRELGMYLASGVTTIRILWGIPFHLRLKKKLDQQNIYGPQFLIASPKLTGEEDQGDDKVQISNPEQAKKLVKQYKKRGYDCIKTYAGMPKNIYDAVVEQSIESDIKIVSHPSHEIPYLDQFHPQIISFEHAEEIVQQVLNYKLDSAQLEIVIDAFVKTNTSFCPTLTGYHKIYEMLEKEDDIPLDDLTKNINPLMRKFDSEVQFNRWANEKANNLSITESISRQHQFHLYIINKMHKAGVNIVCGTDAGIGITEPGYSLHQELGFYQEAGMSNYETLRTATINPSKTHNEFSNIGSIEKGKQANFILSEENPLENLNNLRSPIWMMIEGRKIEKKDLEGFAEKAVNRKNFMATAIRYAEYLIVER